jgi:hypothetical protein
MHPPIGDWDAAYVLSIATPLETAELEKKGSALMDPQGNRDKTVKELAKQVSAFANSGDGFIVYGIDKDGGLDGGVTDAYGRQPIKAWVEGLIPTLVQPTVHNCQARFIQAPSHAGGRGALVVFVPLSERRPHWVPGSPDIPYIRAGEHSSPMPLQSFLDISSRGTVTAAEIESLGRIGESEYDQEQHVHKFYINPVVRLVSAPPCTLWALRLSIPESAGEFRSHAIGSTVRPHEVTIRGLDPLFPQVSTPAASHNIELWIRHGKVAARLSAGAAPPVTRTFDPWA